MIFLQTIIQMKTRFILAGVFVLTSLAAVAQSTFKIGYTNAEFILSNMPEAKQIESELRDYEQQLTTQLESKMQDFQTKLAEFQRTAENMIPEVRNDKQQELQNLQASIEKFQRDAQASLQKKQMELLQPAYDKIQIAIDAVAEEGSYTLILNSGQPEMGLQIILFAREQENISDLVFKKLGIEPPKADASAAGN
jgi:outer membrane protein